MYYQLPYYVPAARAPEPRRLAEHETLELHELLAFKTGGLFKQKQALPHIKDPELHRLYLESIQILEREIVELVSLLQNRPIMR